MTPCLCTQSDAHTKLDIAGAKNWCHHILSHVQVNVGGCGVQVKFGNYIS